MTASLQVRYFASLADRAGCREETVPYEDGCDVRQLWQSLVERHPKLDALGFEPLVACDREYANWDRALTGVQEIAFLPPFSGG